MLTASKVLPAGVHVFWWQVVVGLNKMTKEVCDNVLESMPRGVEAVIRPNGVLATKLIH